MAVLTALQLSRTLTDFTASAVAAAGGGDKFNNTGTQHFYAKNGSGSPITVTFVVQGTLDGLAGTNRTVIVPAGGAALVGPWPTGIYNDANSQVNVTYSGVTSLTVAVVTPGS